MPFSSNDRRPISLIQSAQRWYHKIELCYIIVLILRIVSSFHLNLFSFRYRYQEKPINWVVVDWNFLIYFSAGFSFLVILHNKLPQHPGVQNWAVTQKPLFAITSISLVILKLEFFVLFIFFILSGHETTAWKLRDCCWLHAMRY